MKVVQIFDDNFEGLFKFKDSITDEHIKKTYNEYLEEQDEYFDTYEDFMEAIYPHYECERFYVDSEIYI